jgi:hypothetical protein
MSPTSSYREMPCPSLTDSPRCLILLPGQASRTPLFRPEFLVEVDAVVAVPS